MAGSVPWWLTEVGVAPSAQRAMAESGVMTSAAVLTATPCDAARPGGAAGPATAVRPTARVAPALAGRAPGCPATLPVPGPLFSDGAAGVLRAAEALAAVPLLT